MLSSHARKFIFWAAQQKYQGSISIRHGWCVYMEFLRRKGNKKKLLRAVEIKHISDMQIYTCMYSTFGGSRVNDGSAMRTRT